MQYLADAITCIYVNNLAAGSSSDQKTSCRITDINLVRGEFSQTLIDFYFLVIIKLTTCLVKKKENR